MNQSIRLSQPPNSSTPPPPPPPPPPTVRSSGKPLLSIKGGLQLDGHWHLKCYEHDYVTEHLRLHRFPINRKEQAKEFEQIEQAEAKGTKLKDGRLYYEFHGALAPDGGVQAPSENTSGLDKANGSGGVPSGGRKDIPALQVLRDMCDERSSEEISLMEEQEAQHPTFMTKLDAVETTEPEQPDAAQAASTRSASRENANREAGDELTRLKDQSVS